MGLLDKFFAQKSVNENPVLARLPEGLALFVIGDIHGRLDLLNNLLKKIDNISSDKDTKLLFIFVGDYVDRGPDSKGVIDRLLALAEGQNDQREVVFLRGNHEQVFLDVLNGDFQSFQPWLTFGGLQTLTSYEVFLRKIPTKPDDFEAIGEQLHEKIPDSHRQFLENTRIDYFLGDYYFVHAGVDPDKELMDQVIEDKLWIKDRFTESRRCYEKKIVHGHTVEDEPVNAPNRIGVDTGAYASDILTAAHLRDDQVEFIQTEPTA